MRTITITSGREIEVNDSLADTLEAWMDRNGDHNIVTSGDDIKEMYGEGWYGGDESLWDERTRRWADEMQYIVDHLKKDEIYVFDYNNDAGWGDKVNVNDADFELD